MSIHKGIVAALLGATIGASSAWLLAILSPFVTRRLNRDFQGPKLVLSCEAVPTYTNDPSVIQHDCNVTLANVKPQIAKECWVYLLKIEEVFVRASSGSR